MTTAPGLPRRLFAEALGTALLLAAVVGSGAMGEQLADGNAALALLANALATAAILAVVILVMGPVSGAHLNPVVTLALALARSFPRRDVLPYAGAQLGGAIAGVIVANAMFGLPALAAATQIRSGAPQLLSEVVATFGLVMVIFGCRAGRPAALPGAVALYIGGAYWFTASTSFANPAAAVARSLTRSFTGIAPAGVAAFIVAEVAGALVAVIASRVLWPRTMPAPAGVSGRPTDR